MVHTLRLDNYYPTPRKLVLGTNSSYGIESIKIERGAGWDGLNLTATWHIPGREEPLRVALLDGDVMDVPPEVTKEAKDGVLVLAGMAPGVQLASCNVEYHILEQAGIYGGSASEPTPELAAQVLEATIQAKANAEAAAQDASEAKANANKAQQAAENAAEDAAAKARPYADAALSAKEAAEAASDDVQAAARAAKASEDEAAKSAADADSTANSIKDSMAQISENKEAVSKLKEDLADKVPKSDYAPEAKTDAMTQPVGKDADGKLWTAPGSGGGGGTWSEITDKPFNTIDGNTLVNRSGALCVNTTDDAEQDNTRPITSSGVHVICGNINALLHAI